RRERLTALGLTEAELARLHAPIGLPIGSKTPAEIAISVLAHVIAERSRQRARLAESELAAVGTSEIRSGCQVIPSSSVRAVNGSRRGCGLRVCRGFSAGCRPKPPIR